MRIYGTRFLCFTIAMVVAATSIQSRALYDRNGKDGRSSLALAPSHCVASHEIGKIVLAVNNNGTFATGFTDAALVDCFTGGVIRSCEYPKRSNTTYCFASAFWIGAVVGRDTLVSTGADGWLAGQEEFKPDDPPIGDMIKRSTIDPTRPEYEGAISEEDYISVYTDTTTQGVGNDPLRGPHRALNIEVTERSFAWSYAYAEDFVLFDFSIKNIGFRKIDDAYMGIYVDADVFHQINSTTGFGDDICGFKEVFPQTLGNCSYYDTVNLAWISDNNGDPTAGAFDDQSVPAVTATRIVRTPSKSLDVSFNWWISNGDPSLDFGPREQPNKGRLKEPFRDIGTGGIGTPNGDVNKYYFLRNREFDYDQIYTGSILASDTLWLLPDQDFSRGFDTRYLLSFGPFDIAPGEDLPISLAYVAGERFHRDATNFANLPANPDLFYSKLDFTDLAYNARWASWIYDTPGADTDNDNYKGDYLICVNDSIIDTTGAVIITDADTLYIRGDGVPDFQGASPPPAPTFRLIPEPGRITVRFNGLRSETTRDVFSNKLDFEGYRVHYGRDERSASYTMISSYDLDDYNKYVYDRLAGDFVLIDVPFTLDSLRALYGANLDPNAYGIDNRFTLPFFPDSIFYFAPQDYNASDFRNTNQIHKVWPDQPFPRSLVPEDTVNINDSALTPEGDLKYFEYEYVIKDLLESVPYFVNITAFDYGSPVSGLPSLETSLTIGAKMAYAQNSASEVLAKKPPVYIYPNPYRGDAGYHASGFEGRVDSRPENYVRAVNFANLPPHCTIRIFSLDGDLIKEIQHDKDVSDPTATHAEWNLITRNTQAVVSGLYYWTVEPQDEQGNINGEVQIGKLVVIM
jgi:hypothetical protein